MIVRAKKGIYPIITILQYSYKIPTPNRPRTYFNIVLKTICVYYNITICSILLRVVYIVLKIQTICVFESNYEIIHIYNMHKFYPYFIGI